jgi:oligopeptide transport system permease protein
MVRYIAARIIQAALTLLAIAFATFLLMHSVPGGPFESGDRVVSESFVREQEAYYGLDEPLPQQFGRFVWNLAQGDLGLSFAQRGEGVTDILIERAKPSIILGAMAFAIVLAVGLPLGIVAALRRGGAVDYAALGFTTLLGAVPSFVLAFVLLLVFAVWIDVFDVRLGRGFGDSVGSLKNGILPAFALAAPMMALLSRHMRSALLDVLGADYVRTAQAKGLRPAGVYLRHALRNAWLPVVTLLGPIFADLVTGSVVIETIFGLPGIGSAFVTSIGERDYGMIMGTTLFYAAVIIAANLVVDLAYPLVDPRVRLSR